MFTLDDLDKQMEGDVSPAGLLYLSVGLAIGFGLILGGLFGALLGHFVLDPQLGLAHVTTIASLVGAIAISVLCYVGLRAAASHITAIHR
jgi:uncharacterized protein YqgC (DUF456 family)